LLFLSQGVPMLLAGDERGRTQGGNNNAYCHDSPVSWVNWDSDLHRDLLRFVTRLIAFRLAHPQLVTGGFLDGEVTWAPVAEWHGRRPGEPDWSHESRLVVVQLPGTAATADLCVAMNMHWEPARVLLPNP